MNAHRIAVDIGTPKQTVGLRVDVSSYQTWAISGCGELFFNEDECDKAGTYNDSLSDTSLYVDVPYSESSVDNDDGSSYSLTYYADDFTIQGGGTSLLLLTLTTNTNFFWLTKEELLRHLEEHHIRSFRSPKLRPVRRLGLGLRQGRQLGPLQHRRRARRAGLHADQGVQSLAGAVRLGGSLSDPGRRGHQEVLRLPAADAYRGWSRVRL